AFIRNMDDIWGSASPTVATGGKVIALSTPFGCNNWFYKTYTEATEGVNGFFPMCVNWWDNPDYAKDLEKDDKTPGGYTSPWFKEMIRDKSDNQVRSEFLTTFIDTGNTFLTPDQL